MLIVINGSIASGKSTLSRKLAAALRTLGHQAAVIELDRVYEMLADDPKSDQVIWRSARRLPSSDRVVRTDLAGAEPLARELAELAQTGQLGESEGVLRA